ncbi:MULTISPECIES: MarR family winged helix-turn-helix transcriptional regulator [Brevibacillus]|jgi:DNA-binding MarR family transcriptional regulator|uniref:Transcriptional regulator n=1 Tax=Brevibacillus borstelensis AK1 TaxID=1300222 RepID=M8DMI6_9BACL|nr:MarR family transcriptional regulator [Brevibacillus borstelensis]EMT54677.1 transcriptional regulator [Brevibacillus borstelensis AK1]KKX54237.1 transcriptional regulator [Brevibacillus borstelensis cifa_chp40]MBE5396952.1 MarR family transcriptional regulator [Brevibacillus borstelensis]MCC0567346.1 MarR family transcriptional regulator [Brevibacillus borstelensis]MCM3471734.1 MarR family transcriptional regulator [Brevibacillus borstelensis]
MHKLYDLFLKTGLRPFAFMTDMLQLEQKVTRSDLATLLILLFRGDLTMTELAAEMGAPLSSMTSIAKRLERKGYIARATSPKDQRVKLVMLTQEGIRLAKEWERIMLGMLGKLEAAFTPEELEQFTLLSYKAIKVFQDEEPVKLEETKNRPVKIKIDE